MIQGKWISLGKTDYDEALQIQNASAEKLLADASQEQTVYTVEHPPTITIGRAGSRENIVASKERLDEIGMSVYDVDRGGDVTYHGPGQLVVYPVLHLEPWGNDITKYVFMLEEVVIRALQDVGITSNRAEGLPGVWVGNNKICAVGARARRRLSREFVTSHGIALNVSTNLSHFSTIIPCGISDKGVTSLEQEMHNSQSWLEWEGRIRKTFSEVFEMELTDK